MGVLIKTPQLDMEIKIVPITQLHIHEKTIPQALEKLKMEIISQQVLKHPILVDTKSFVVLDGMHRVAALKSLDFLLAPVCLVDYSNPSIKLFTWYRQLDRGINLLDFISTIKERFSYELSSVSLKRQLKW